MKASRSLHSLFLAAVLAVPAFVHAQTVTTAVPGFISYQGRVLDGSGNPVGAGTPVNRTVIFRIWDHPSNTLTANLIYAEQQTVTVSEGEFSVLVGQGVAVTSTTQFGYSEAAKKLADLSTAFSGSVRYLGVTVDDGADPAENEITPRQQIVSSGFAFRSKFAEALGTSTGGTALSVLNNGNVGIGKTPGTALDVNGTVTATQFSGSGAGLSALPAGQLTGTVLDARLSSNVALLSGISTFTGQKSFTANVGIGTTTPGFPLSFSDSIGDKISLWGQSGNHYGFGVNAGLLQIHTPGAGDDIAFGYGRSAAFNETMRIKGNGLVGIGTTAPLAPLHVSSAGIPNAIIDGSSTSGTWLALRNTSVGGTNWQLISTGSGNGAGTLLFATGPAPSSVSAIPMAMKANGNIGIGTTDPTQARLVVSGSVSQDGLTGAYINNNFAGDRVTHGLHPVSLYTTDTIWCGNTVIATSDQRIKNIAGRTNGADDLKTLQGIEITDFRYKDVISKGDTPQKKVIAQQVEKVFPQAVSRHTGVVPDIYKKATVKNGWVQLRTNLKTGERVHLIGEKKEGIQKVLEVADGKFRTDFEAADGEQVFVFGREVNDLHAVDYEAISMLNVSATQQIKKEKDAEMKSLQEENAALRKELAALKSEIEKRNATDKAQDAKLAAIERALTGQTAGKTVSRAVSSGSRE